MPTGQSLVVYSPIPPVSTAHAISVIPPGRLYDSNAGLPEMSPNADAIMGQIAQSGLSLGHEVDGPNPSVIKAINRMFGTNFNAQTLTKASLASVAATQQEQGVVLQHTSDTSDAIAASQEESSDDITGILSIVNHINSDGPEIWANVWGNFPLVDVCFDYRSSLLMVGLLSKFLADGWYGQYSKGASFDQQGWQLPNLSQCLPDTPDLTDTSWVDQGDMSDFDYVVSKHPELEWESNHMGGGRVGVAIPFVQGGVTVSTIHLYYRGKPVTLENIFHLWDYTPTSGPPVRNGITDSMQIYALLPVQF